MGDVIGFALRWDGQEHGVLWISGDTVLYDGVRSVAERLQVDTAIVHLGGVRFPVSGPLRYTMTAAHTVELCGLIAPRAVIPIHYDTFPLVATDAEAFKQDVENAGFSQVYVLNPGDTHSLR